MPRIQGLTEAGPLTGATLLKTGEGYVFSITIAWKGATVGDMVYLRDGTSQAGTVLVAFAFPTANGTISREWSNGKKYLTGLFYDEAGVVDVFTELTFK